LTMRTIERSSFPPRPAPPRVVQAVAAPSSETASGQVIAAAPGSVVGTAAPVEEERAP
jgi:hypothetical protein